MRSPSPSSEGPRPPSPQEVENWAASDIDDADRHELRHLLQTAQRGGSPGTAAWSELTDRFHRPLRFGTAGLRAPLRAGPNGMNRAVVVRTTAGLAAWLDERLSAAEDAPAGPLPRTGPALVVVGFDARHRSRQMAIDTAGVLVAHGCQVVLFSAAGPTPLLARAVRLLVADAGVMITASHNPASDNGYKVYLGGRAETGTGQGAQIIPPHDARISTYAAAAPSAREVARASSGWSLLGDEVEQDYLSHAATLEQPSAGRLRVVVTAMHGVGGHLLVAALRQSGVSDVVPVETQHQPDADFPTVDRPNPEEPGALDLALARARSVQADLMLAVDPDADRCAVAAPSRDGREWVRLTGDEVGALLGAQAAERIAAPQTYGDRPRDVLASSLVSSRLLARIAAYAGVKHRTTLTGFKWIARVDRLAFGYEEAIGYCVDPEHVRDKDGISAAVRFTGLVAAAAAAGRHVLDLLDDLARIHGLHLTAQVTVRTRSDQATTATLHRLLDEPPTALGTSRVISVTDLATRALPTPGIEILAADDTRLVVRPSGTEPTIKAYLEVVVPVRSAADAEAMAQVRTQAHHRLDALGAQVRELLTDPPRPA